MAREADDRPERLAGQVPCRWRSRSSEGLGPTRRASIGTGTGAEEGPEGVDAERGADRKIYDMERCAKKKERTANGLGRQEGDSTNEFNARDHAHGRANGDADRAQERFDVGRE